MKKYVPLTKEQRKEKEEQRLKDMAEKWTKAIAESNMPWQKPWKAGTFPMDHNPITSGEKIIPYKGSNMINLYLTRLTEGLTDTRWITFSQMLEKNSKEKNPQEHIFLRKGSESSIKTKFTPITLDENGKVIPEDRIKDYEGKKTVIPSLKYFMVFNAEQFYKKVYDEKGNIVLDENGNPKERPAFEKEHQLETFSDNSKAENLLKISQAKIYYDQIDRCYYTQTFDEIHLVEKKQFSSEKEFYNTALHELIHWTGHTSREGRTFGKKKGDKEYAREELVAEIGSYLLCKELDIDFEPTQQNVSYVKHWFEILNENPNVITEVCRDATRAVEFLTNPNINKLQNNNLNNENNINCEIIKKSKSR